MARSKGGVDMAHKFKNGDLVKCVNLKDYWAVRDGLEIGSIYQVSGVGASSTIAVTPAKKSFLIQESCFELAFELADEARKDKDMDKQYVTPWRDVTTKTKPYTKEQIWEFIGKDAAEEMKVRDWHVEKIAAMHGRHAEFVIRCIQRAAQVKAENGYKYVDGYGDTDPRVVSKPVVEEKVVELPDDEARAKELAAIVYNGDFGDIEDAVAQLTANITGIKIESLEKFRVKRAKKQESATYGHVCDYPYKRMESTASVSGGLGKFLPLVITHTEWGKSYYVCGNVYVNKNGNDNCAFGFGKNGKYEACDNYPHKWRCHMRPASIDEIVGLDSELISQFITKYGMGN